MSPWLEAETEDESRELAVFSRRARALPEAALPSLNAILREADAPRLARARRVERGRSLAAAFAAAACVAALFTRAPGFEAAGAIVAEEDAGAPGADPSRSVASRASRGDGETCAASADEGSARSTCALTTPSVAPSPATATPSGDATPAATALATGSEALALMTSSDTGRACFELPASIDYAPASLACKRATSCATRDDGVHAGP